MTIGVDPAPIPSTPFCASVVEHHAATQRLAIEAQRNFFRIIEMARLIEEASADLPPTSEHGRILICAEVIREAAVMARGEIERIEAACTVLGAAMRREANHA